MQQLDEISFFDSSGLSRQEVEEFLNKPRCTHNFGRGLYPRYYSI